MTTKISQHGVDSLSRKQEKNLNFIMREIKREGTVFSVAFSPDGTRLAVGGDEKKVVVFDAKSWGVVHEVTREQGVLSVAFSPDGTWLARGGIVTIR